MPKKVYPKPTATKPPLVPAAAPSFDPRDTGDEEASIAAARAELTLEKEPPDADTPSSSASASRSTDGKEEDWQDEEWKEVYAALMEPTPEGAETPDCLADLGEFKRGKFFHHVLFQILQSLNRLILVMK